MSSKFKFVRETCGTCYQRLYRGYSEDEELRIAIMAMPAYVSSSEEYLNSKVMGCRIIYADEDHELMRYLLGVIMDDCREIEVDHVALERYILHTFPCLEALGFRLESSGYGENPIVLAKLTEN